MLLFFFFRPESRSIIKRGLLNSDFFYKTGFEKFQRLSMKKKLKKIPIPVTAVTDRRLRGDLVSERRHERVSDTYAGTPAINT